jgi:hypothetical protein
MADHLSYIRIRGLEGDPEECFQGIGTSGGDGTGGSPSAPFEWGAIPEEALSLIEQYTNDLNDWITKAQDYDPESADRGLPGSRMLPAVIGAAPLIPAIIGTITTGGAALPAVAAVMLSQTLMGVVGSSIQNYAATLDPNSAQSLLKKAFLYKDGAVWKSIFKQALLYDIDSENKDQSVLNDRLKDLLFNDEEIDFGAFRAYLRGKVIEY